MNSLLKFGAENNTGVLRSPLIENVPAAFIHKNAKNETLLYGPYVQFMLNFAFYNNFGLELYNHTNFDNSRTYDGIRNGQYNLSLHPKLYTRNFEDIDFSYPVEWVKRCVMVPSEEELPKYLYVIWPFGRYIWTLIAISVVYIAVLLHYIRTDKNGKIHTFSSNLLQSIAIVMYCSNMNVNIRNAKVRVIFFYTLLFVFGFILSAYHAPYLTAYNLKPVFFPPINTVQDLLKSQLQIHVPQEYLDKLRLSTDINIVDLEPYMIGMECTPFLKLLESFNRSYAYVISLEQWKHINRQQRHLKHPHFHLSEVCFGSLSNAYVLQHNASFKKTLHTFMLAVQQSGLWKQWEEQAFYTAIAAGHTKILLDTYPVESLSVGFFKIAWIILLVGLTASTITFLIELYISHTKTSR